MKLIHIVGVAGTAAVLAAVAYAGSDLFGTVGWGVPQTLAQSRPPAAKPSAPPPAQPAQPTAPSVPVRTERTVYDAWTVTCSEPMEKGSKKTCSALFQLVEEKQRNVMLAWIIGRDPQGVLRTVFQVPTGVQIAKGLQLTLGTRPPRMLPYVACRPQQCEASTAMDDAMVRDASASQEAVATIVLADGRSVNFKMGIKGIEQAFLALGK